MRRSIRAAQEAEATKTAEDTRAPEPPSEKPVSIERYVTELLSDIFGEADSAKAPSPSTQRRKTHTTMHGGVRCSAKESADIDSVVERVMAAYAGGQVLPSKHQWVIRALRALECQHRAAMRDEQLRLFRSELQVSHFQGDVERLTESLRVEKEARRKAEREVAELRQKVSMQEEVAAGLHSHNTSLVQETKSLARQLEEAHQAHRATRTEVVDLYRKWQSASTEAAQWRAKCETEQGLLDRAKDEANDAWAAEAAVRRVLLGEAEYKLAQESGYELDTVMTMVPSRRTVTFLGRPWQNGDNG